MKRHKNLKEQRQLLYILILHETNILTTIDKTLKQKHLKIDLHNTKFQGNP